MKREQFTGWIADRFQERHVAPLDRTEAEQMGAECLEAFEDMEALKFGQDDYAWDQDLAHALADEEIHAGWETL